MKLWEIRAVADAQDPRWQGGSAPRRILVAARSAADARLLASAKLVGTDETDIANEAGPSRSVVSDEKLYRVSPAENDGRAATDEAGVLAIEY